ncbi:MAG TPA: metallopeptidase TldD-related protein [Elusimicrobiota bacterium]|nr:metallopeptidase TldD-related protein [Elusimicrobiota bacterium]
MMKPRAELAAALLLLGAAGARAQDVGALDRAMATELARSTATLRQDDNPLPYFVSIRVTDEEGALARCQMGRVSGEARHRSRRATPDVRVGSRELDNHPIQPTASAEGADIPADGDVFALRHALWTTLDPAYKAAVAGFLRKQALRVRRGKADYETDDLDAQPAAVLRQAGFERPWEDARPWARDACRAGTAAFRGRPRTLSADSDARVSRARERLLTSEGTDVAARISLAQIGIHATDIADDGMLVSVSRSFIAPEPADLPGPDRLERESREMMADLDALRASVSTSPMTAPALVDPSVSAALFQALAARLSGEEQRNPSGAQTFKGKLGQAVLPSHLTLVDDPTVSSFRGAALAGAYAVDDQGVPARKVTLVENGVLRGFLLSRYPVVGAGGSNGHGRAAPGQAPMGRPGNLFVRSSAPLSPERLLERLLRECRRQGKPHGLLVVRARGWSQQGGTGRQQAFRLTPTLIYLVDAATGKKTLVRDLDLVGTPIELAARIVAAGDDAEAVNAVVEQESGRIPVATVAPSLLLSEVELQRSESKPQKQPILPPPDAPKD